MFTLGDLETIFMKNMRHIAHAHVDGDGAWSDTATQKFNVDLHTLTLQSEAHWSNKYKSISP